jgi:hypothetical protein
MTAPSSIRSARDNGPVTEGQSYDDKHPRAQRLIEAGAGFAGATGGAALSVFLTGGSGVVEGAAAGAALGSTLAEIGTRLLGHREMARVGGAARYAGMAYQKRIAAGDNLRDDGWFDERPGGRSAAAEICEGTLVIAQREHQERKIEFYGYLLANLSFDPDVDEYLANWLLKLVSELTWMQLVLVAMIGRRADFTLPNVGIGVGMGDWTQWGLHEQLADLGFGRRELISARSLRRDPESVRVVGSGNLTLAGAELAAGGRLLFELMWLDRIPASDIELAVDLLQPDNGATTD